MNNIFDNCAHFTCFNEYKTLSIMVKIIGNHDFLYLKHGMKIN